ncbi:MAG: tetratricopeptide repeat protein [Anaerolineae bacterium]|nr:tetratricopeptide repeat protein [Anaerolineae bacterium]
MLVLRYFGGNTHKIVKRISLTNFALLVCGLASICYYLDKLLLGINSILSQLVAQCLIKFLRNSAQRCAGVLNSRRKVMTFNPHKLNQQIIRGFEAIRFVKSLDKLAADSFIAEKMLALTKAMGEDSWAASSIRRLRSSSPPKTPFSLAVLNKYVYVCLEATQGFLGAKWAEETFTANGLGREDMHPLLLKQLKPVADAPGVEGQKNEIVTPSIPLQRPTRPAFFVGRSRELKQLLDALAPGRIVALCGPGGIGKSALAGEAIWQLTEGDLPPKKFPHGIIFYNFYNCPEVDAALEHIVLSLGETPGPNPANAVIRVLARMKILLVFDGAEVAEDLSTLLSLASGCGVLLTTRQRMDNVHFRMDLGTLPIPEAVELLQSLKDFTATSEAHAQEICELVGGLPLAVQLAGRYMAATNLDVANYLKWLSYTPLAALDHGTRGAESIPVLLRHSIAQVSERSQQMLIIIGALAMAPFNLETVAAGLQISIWETTRACGELVNYGLLRYEAQRYVVHHKLIYTYLSQNLPATAQIIIQLGLEFVRIMRDTLYGEEKLANLDHDYRHILAIIPACKQRRQWLLVIELVGGIDRYLDFRGLWNDRITACEDGLYAVRVLQDRTKEAMLLGILGFTHARKGQLEAAIDAYEQALKIAEDLNNQEIMAHLWMDFGNVFNDFDQAHLALECFQQALAIAIKMGREEIIQRCNGQIGYVLRNLGEAEKAIEYLEGALDSARKTGNLLEENTYLGNLGLAYLKLGEVDQAIKLHRQALEISQRVDDKRMVSLDLGNLGVAYSYTDQAEAAESYLQQALEISRNLGDRYLEAQWLGYLAYLAYKLGRLEESRIYRAEAMTIFAQIGMLDSQQVQSLLAWSSER